MKNIYILLSFIFISCSLDFPVEDEITGMNAIDQIAIAGETLSNIYTSIPKNKLVFSKLADDLYPNHTIDDNPSDYFLYKWNENQIKYLSNDLWVRYYATISKANLLLSRIPEIKAKTNKEKIKLNNIKAETLSLKALCYFDLILIYSDSYTEQTKNNNGIILKDKIKKEELPRSTIEDCFKATESILNEAISTFSDDIKTCYRFSKYSAKGLLAKLYFNWKKYDKSILLCDEIIEKNQITPKGLKESWKELQKNYKDITIESILLALDSKSSYFSEIHDIQEHNDEYYINHSIKYDIEDLRKKTTNINRNFKQIGNSITKENFLGKLRNEIDDEQAKPIPVMRIPEFYFIKSECLYHLSKVNEAKKNINKYLQIIKSKEVKSDSSTFLNDLLKEKQKEFIGEGIRYFDLKRNNIELIRVDSRKNKTTTTIKPDDYRWLFPIEKNEMKYNNKIVNNKNW